MFSAAGVPNCWYIHSVAAGSMKTMASASGFHSDRARSKGENVIRAAANSTAAVIVQNTGVIPLAVGRRVCGYGCEW